MSHCPTNDIHSIYLDNEMPEIYKAEYEAHIAQCSACQKKLNALKALHTAFTEESSSLTPDSHYLDQSFERLQTKMKYRKNTGAAKDEESKTFKYIKYVVPAAAAAAVFALVIPIRLNSGKAGSAAPEATVAAAPITLPMNSATNVSLGGGNGRVISGNIHETVLPYAAMNKPPRNRGMGMDVNKGGLPERAFRTPDTSIQSTEVFGPAFSEDNTISIKITIPGVLGDVPLSTEVTLPDSKDVTDGQE